MNKATIVIGAALALTFLSGTWTDIVPDLTAMGVNEHITHIGSTLLIRGTEAVAAVATLMHLVLPRVVGGSAAGTDA